MAYLKTLNRINIFRSVLDSSGCCGLGGHCQSPYATGEPGLVANPQPTLKKKKIIRLLIAAQIPCRGWTVCTGDMESVAARADLSPLTCLSSQPTRTVK